MLKNGKLFGIFNLLDVFVFVIIMLLLLRVFSFIFTGEENAQVIVSGNNTDTGNADNSNADTANTDTGNTDIGNTNTDGSDVGVVTDVPVADVEYRVRCTNYPEYYRNAFQIGDRLIAKGKYADAYIKNIEIKPTRLKYVDKDSNVHFPEAPGFIDLYFTISAKADDMKTYYMLGTQRLICNISHTIKTNRAEILGVLTEVIH